MVEMADAGDGLYRRGFAGDTFNTAWYARRLLPRDWRVGYASAIGKDAVSVEMKAFFEEQGIETAALREVEDRTVGLYMISLDNGERSFSYWRSQSAAKTLADDPAWLTDTLSGQDILYFSGITLAILTPAARRRLCDAIMSARAGGAMVAFDTNLRPRLWEDKATMQDGMLLGASVADVVLPSFDEETQLFGDTTPGDTIKRYRNCGARVVAVKNGNADLTLWDADGTRTLQTTQVTDVIDTTAAGDSFGAGFMAGLATGQSCDQAAHSAMSLAAQVIQSRGALVPSLFEEGTA
ncbi:sugar kinase [Actibacterium pelagium]|uniref:2-dehydro-3-deoxygluconokinase n=1 Tax=Actibacterium pelagium TaxID=2029103 RepID=A0A917AJZ1_9RHOB|nr:sugar kinase [Actibacterium pelagium]GGE58189.1 2-dehydro-3-deoxygluconokinase [Actibacterium pelagium]